MKSPEKLMSATRAQKLFVSLVPTVFAFGLHYNGDPGKGKDR
jgi:hypothetical protein